MDRNPNVPNIRKPYENNYTKTYEGSTWRGAQENGNPNVERYGQKPAPRFNQGATQFNGHQGPQNDVVQNGADGKPVRQPRPNTYQNRQNGTYVPRNNNNVANNGAAGTGGHQYVPNPNTNGYQGNRGKPEVSFID